MVRETRHLWVGNLPETIRNEKIVEHFERYGRVESVKILPRRSMEGGRAAFVDFVDIRSATKAHESVNRIGDRELRTDYNEPSGNSSSMTMARIHGDLRGEPRIDQNSPGDTRVRAPPQPVSPARRRYDRRSEGVLESHYSNRQPGSYDDGYSDNEGGPPRQAISGGRPRYADRGSHGNRSYHRGDMMRRNNMGKTDFHSRGVAVSPSSESDSDSESQSASKSVSGTSSQTSSSDDDSEAESRAVNPASEHMSGHSGRATALCIRNLSMRSSDSSIKEGLFHEFKKYGEVNRIYIHGQGNNRYAVIYFKRAEDADRGMDACHGKMFLGSEMNISLWHESPPKQYKQYDNYYDRYEGDYPPRSNRGNLMAVEDEYDPAATRTLFVGNIEKTTTYGDLKEAFERYGEIVDIDIKKQAGNNPYAFLQFADLHCAIQARRRMDREYVGRNKVKVGFGKVSPINTIWVGGVTASLSEQQLERHFHRYGHVTRVVINRLRGQALISFDSVESAGVAQADMKGRLLYGRRVRVEFVSRDSRQLFFDDMQRLGQDDRRRYYDNPSHDSRPRGRGGFYDRRGGHRGGRGMRGDVRYSGYRQWHGPDYEYRDGGGFHRQGGHPRHRGPYDGYESDDYDKELRDYENFSRQREREKERYRERQRERHERDNHPRNKDEGDYSENERYYMDERDRWQDHECSSGSYIEEEPRDRKDRRLREVAVERRHNRVQHRETGDESENEAGPVLPGIKEYEREAVCEPEQQLKLENNDSDYNDKVSTISERHKEQPEKKRKKKEKNIKKLRKSSEFEKVKAEEMATNENVTGHRKKRSLSKDGSRVSEDNEIAAEVVPKGPKTPEPQESEHNEKCALPSPTEEKIVKSKKTTSKKKKKHKRIRTPPEPEVDEETPNVEEVQLSEEKQTEGYEGKESISEKVSESGHLENEVKTSAAADVQVMSEKKEKETRSSEDDDKNFSRFPLPDVHIGKRDPSVSPRKQYREDESLKRERSASPRKSYKDEEPNYKHSKGDGLYKVDKSIREEKVNREEKLFREEKLHRDEKPYRDRDSKLYREEKTVREEKPYRHEKTYRTDKQFAEEKTHKDEKSYKETRPYRDNDKSYREEKMYREDKGHSKERRREWEEKERPKRAKVSREESPPPPPPPPPADNVVLSESRTPEARPLPPLGQEMGQYDTNRGSLGLYSPATHSPMQVVGKKQTAAVLGTPTPPMMSPSTHALPLPTQQQYITSTAPLGAPAAPTQQHNSADTLLDLLRRYPVMWQGIIALKNDQAAVQMHYLAGNAQLAELSLPQIPVHGMGGVPPPLRISQRMRLEQSQLEGVIRRMQVDNEHCLLLALPCGRDPLDVHAQTRALRNGFINYLQQKQAAGIINVAGQGSSQPSYVLHIFPPCDFAQEHLARVSPDLLDSAADSGHLMVVVASV